MKVSIARLRIITCLRMERRWLTAVEIATLLGEAYRNVSACLRGLEGHQAIAVDRSRRPFKYKLAPAGYIAVGSFPPKEERHDEETDEQPADKTAGT